MLYRAPRGTYDILPDQHHYWQFIKEKAALISTRYGYDFIDTPVFEDSGLFVRSIGEETDIVEKEMYTFQDQGGDLITLRPEGTAPICRAYLEHGMHNMTQPVKLYYIAQIFRYERPQAGRFRQHWQFGAEAIGESDPALDAEIIEMASTLYHTLGLRKLVLKLNSIGCPNCRPGYFEALKGHYSDKQELLCPECRRRIRRNPLRLLDCKNETCIPFTEQAPRSFDYLCSECEENFRSVKKYLSLLEIDFELDYRLVRGLDYYTRTVFEFQPEGATSAQSALGGGGRYDNLIEELGGRPTPAVGFGTGFERIILNLKNQGVEVPTVFSPPVFVAYLGEEAKNNAIKYVSRMRQQGLKAVMSSGNRSLKAQMRQANSLEARLTLIIGEDEITEDVVVIKDMTNGEQQRISFDKALEKMSAF